MHKFLKASEYRVIKKNWFPYLLKKFVLFVLMKPCKNDENYFLFHPKSSFRSQDIQIFLLTSWSYRKNGLTRNKTLISKFMTSQPG